MSSSTSYSSETSSDRSHHDEPYDPVCTYRTPQFHDLECSRYFDCPTHTIERARSETAAEDDDQDDDQDEGLDANEEDEDDDDDDEDQHNDDDEDDEEDEDEELFQEESQGGGDEHEELSLQPGEVSPLSEEGPLDRQSGKSPERGRTLESHSGGQHDIIDLTTPSPGPRQEASPIAGPSNRAGYASVVVDLTSDSPPQSVGRDAAETSGEERALPNIPMTDVGLDSPVQRVGEAELLSAQRRPATPPSPPPPIRRRTSSNNFDNPPRSTQPQLQRSSAGRRPSDIVLPRWQPDAEVTICPICHTQFSIFVRKHHCRYVFFSSFFLQLLYLSFSAFSFFCLRTNSDSLLFVQKMRQGGLCWLFAAPYHYPLPIHCSPSWGTTARSTKIPVFPNQRRGRICRLQQPWWW